MQLKLLLLIGAGSFLGGILRYLLSQAVNLRFNTTFPLGTFLINIIGCFVIGFVFVLFDKPHPGEAWRLFLMTGLLGGFTTFSAFSMESVALMKTGHTSVAVLYIVASLVVGMGATFSGIWISKMM